MKVILISFILCCSNLFSQKKLDITAYMGMVQLVTDRPDIIQDGDFVNGWKIGVGSRIHFNRFYFNPAIEARFIDVLGTNKIEIFRNNPLISSIYLPILAGYDLYRNDHFKFRINTGLTPSILLNVDNNRIKLHKEDLAEFNFFYTIGIGFDFHPLTIDFGYDVGLTNHYKEPEFKSNQYNFTIGFIIY